MAVPVFSSFSLITSSHLSLILFYLSPVSNCMPEHHPLEQKDLKQDLNTHDTPTKVAGGVSVKRLRYGIFNVVYAVNPWKLPSCIDFLKGAGDGIAEGWVFIREVYTVAPVAFMTFVTVKLSKSFIAAMSLYVVCRILAIVSSVIFIFHPVAWIHRHSSKIWRWTDLMPTNYRCSFFRG